MDSVKAFILFEALTNNKEESTEFHGKKTFDSRHHFFVSI
jgi:hypothetical protein